MAKKKNNKKKSLKSKENNNKNSSYIIYIIIGLGILLRLLFPLFNVGLWHDECALAINILDREFWGLFNPLRFLQTAPPLFSCLTKIFTIEGNVIITDFSIRIVPLLAGIGSIFAFYNLLRNIFTNKFVIIIGLIIFTFNPILINYSYELKPYSMDVFIAILLTTYFIKYNPEGYWRQFYQILLLSFSMMFSLPAAFIMLGGIFLMLFKDYRRFLYAISAFGLFITFYFIYHLWGTMEVHGAKMDQYWNSFFITFNNLSTLTTNFIKTNFNLFINPIITLCVLGLGFFITCVRDKKLAIISFIIIVEVFIASYLHLYPFAPRLTLFIIPFLTIYVCEIFDMFSEKMPVSKIFPIIIGGLTIYALFVGNLGKFTINTNKAITVLANNAQKDSYAIAIPKNSNVEWIYYSRFYDFSNNRIYFQDWNVPTNEWIKQLPRKNLYYFAPFETRLPEKILKKNPTKITKGLYRI